MSLNKKQEELLQHIYDFVLEFSTDGSDLYNDIGAARDEADTIRWSLEFDEDINITTSSD